MRNGLSCGVQWVSAIKQIRFESALQKTALSLLDFNGWCGGVHIVRTPAPAAGLQTKGKGPPAKKKCTKSRLVVALRARASAAQRSEESRPSGKKTGGRHARCHASLLRSLARFLGGKGWGIFSGGKGGGSIEPF